MFTEAFPAPVEDPAQLAKLGIWPEPVYRDLLAVEAGALSEAEFRDRYRHRGAVLVLDITGFTATAAFRGEVGAFLRLLRVHQLCDPILRKHGARLLRAFADDMIALFDDANSALRAAFEVHARIRQANRLGSGGFAAACRIGIGYGDVYAIGSSLPMGNEVNLAAKLGEDTAKAGETLLTHGAHQALRGQAGVSFVERAGLEASGGFSYFTAESVGER